MSARKERSRPRVESFGWQALFWLIRREAYALVMFAESRDRLPRGVLVQIAETDGWDCGQNVQRVLSAWPSRRYVR